MKSTTSKRTGRLPRPSRVQPEPVFGDGRVVSLIDGVSGVAWAPFARERPDLAKICLTSPAQILCQAFSGGAAPATGARGTDARANRPNGAGPWPPVGAKMRGSPPPRQGQMQPKLGALCPAPPLNRKCRPILPLRRGLAFEVCRESGA